MDHPSATIDFGLKNMLRYLPSCAFIKDHRGSVLFGNPAFSDLFNVSDAEYPLEPGTLLSLQNDELCLVEEQVLLTKASLTGKDVTLQLGPNNERIFVYTCTPWLEEEGQLLGTIQILRDVTLVRENEQALAFSQTQLQAALEQQKELNDLKTRFISTISHEYRNPLAALRASLETLLRLGDRVDSEMRRQRYEKMIAEVQRMTDLMEDVLFIGREEALQTEKKFEAVDMAELVKSFVTDLEPEKQARVALTLSGISRPILGSALHLSQIVQNLIGNALKYSDEGIIVELFWEKEAFRLLVIDHGIGIPTDDQSNIFESFFRSENVGMITGTGLGLFIVKRAVDLHQGSISFESEVNKGTSISVSIPINPAGTGRE